ncbi:glycosyltransferase family 2 protein [Flavobacterium sp. j3]|uniref:Glycosyltransferase family 2 protein n=1 Tax=Flavobacterium aureirubrum TaxID=3133147 RepID=A0ABU9N2X7_9FLAO
MDISVVIVNYRGWKSLDECLHSLKEIISTTLQFEVIIIDNFSNDNKLEDCKKRFSEFKFYENSGNNGFANGCNFGASKSIGKYILFLNPDTKITTEALEKLLQTAVSNPEIGILSCLQVNENNLYYNQKHLFPKLGRFFGISRIFYRKLYKNKLKGRFETNSDLFYPDWVSGAVVFISREWFDKIKGWNEDYWMYFEDVDLCHKVTLNGGKIAVTRKTTIFHKHGGASRINVKTKALTKTEVIISKHVYISNYFNVSEQILIQTLLILDTVIKKLILSILSLFLFFIPKLIVHRLLLKNIIRYYYQAILNKTWISPRSMNYLKMKS